MACSFYFYLILFILALNNNQIYGNTQPKLDY